MIIPPLRISTTTATDGQEDIRRAAAELAERLPESARAAWPGIAYNYRWSWLPGGPGAVRGDRPRALRAVRAEPRPPAPGGAGAGAARAAADDGARRARRRARGAGRLPISSGPPSEPRSSDRPRPVAFLCAEYGVHVSLPVYSGGLGALAGDLLKEASDRGAAARRGRADVPQGLLPPARRRRRLAARVLGRHRPRAAARGAGHRRRRRAADDHRPDRRRVEVDGADLAGRRRPGAAVPARHRLRRERRRSSAGSPRVCTTPTRRHAARPVRAARRGWHPGAAGDGHRAGRDPPQRGPRRARARRARSPRRRRRPAAARAASRLPASGRCSPPTRRCRPATTPTQPSRSSRRSAAGRTSSGSTPSERDRARPHAPGATRRSRSA